MTFLLSLLARPAVLGAVAALLIGTYAGAELAGWHYDGKLQKAAEALQDEKDAHAADLRAIAEAAATAARKNLEEQQRLQREIAETDGRYQEELQRVQQANDALRTSLRSGAHVMRVPPARAASRGRRVPAAPASACLGDGPAAGQGVPGDVAGDIAGLAGRADEVAARLSALQAYARAVSAPRAP